MDYVKYRFCAFLKNSLLFTVLLMGLMTGCGGNSSSSGNLPRQTALPPSSSSSSSVPTESSSSSSDISSQSSSSSSASESSSSRISSSISSSSVSSSSTPPETTFNSTYCNDFTVALTEAEGNIYTFEAPANGCFGVLNDGAQKKTLPLILDGEEDPYLQINNKIKLYNSTTEVNTRRVLASFEVTNTAPFPICFIDPVVDIGISLYNAEDEEIALLSNSYYLNGVLYPLNSSIVAATNTCLMPGQTLTYLEENDGLPVEVINAAAYATTGRLAGKKTERDPLPNIAVTELSVQHPNVTASFVNNTGSAIDFKLDFSHIRFYDEDGYVVHDTFLDIATQHRYTIESGDSFVLSGESLIHRIWPITANKAVIYLNWSPKE